MMKYTFLFCIIVIYICVCCSQNYQRPITSLNTKIQYIQSKDDISTIKKLMKMIPKKIFHI